MPAVAAPRRRLWLVLTIAAILLLAALGRQSLYYVLPFRWTGEPARLAALLEIRQGQSVADIGAGDGALALEIARLVGRGGRVYATEIDPDKRRRIATRAAEASLPQLTVVEAAGARTNLPDGCCEAIYMRNVWHHLDDREAFAAEVAKALRPGGRVAIMDFAPGALLHLGGSHGVTADDVSTAFGAAGLQEINRSDDWGGGMFLRLFRSPASGLIRPRASTAADPRASRAVREAGSPRRQPRSG